MHANLCVYILASIVQDGGKSFPVTRLPVLTAWLIRHNTLLLTSLHMVWSRQVYIIHRSITGFLVVQEATCTHAHEYRLLGASCFVLFCFYFFWCHICACKFMPARQFYNYAKNKLQIKTIFFLSVQRESNSRPLNLQTNALSTGPRRQALIF